MLLYILFSKYIYHIFGSKNGGKILYGFISSNQKQNLVLTPKYIQVLKHQKCDYEDLSIKR